MDDYKQKYENEHQLRIKNGTIISHMEKWMFLMEDGISLSSFFDEKGCKKIAIYGGSAIGRVLIKEIEKSNGIEVSCIIDKNAERIRKNYQYPVYRLVDYMDSGDIDMVVVTPMTYFDTIQRDLLRIRPEIPVVNIARIIEIVELEAWDGKTV